ncbi:hypothetical protein MTO96_006564 [Rhipicephalus appendiculatus]
MFVYERNESQEPKVAFSKRPKHEILYQLLSGDATIVQTPRPSHCSQKDYDDLTAEPVHQAALGLACESEQAVETSPESVCMVPSMFGCDWNESREPRAALSKWPEHQIFGQLLSLNATIGHTPRPSHCCEEDYGDLTAERVHQAALDLARELGQAVETSPKSACELGRGTKYTELLHEQKHQLRQFDKSVDRLDEFYPDLLKFSSSYSELWSIVKLLLVLSHGQATVERGFSVNRQVSLW